MAYNPAMYGYSSTTAPTYPYGYQGNLGAATTQYGSVQPMNGLVPVTGIDGAKAFQLPPNSVMPLFDNDNDIMYIKTTDGAGFPTIKAYKFELLESEPLTQNEYVPRSEFDNLVSKVDRLLSQRNSYKKRGGGNAEQPVSQSE